jgi:hypothetical protein
MHNREGLIRLASEAGSREERATESPFRGGIFSHSSNVTSYRSQPAVCPPIRFTMIQNLLPTLSEIWPTWPPRSIHPSGWPTRLEPYVAICFWRLSQSLTIHFSYSAYLVVNAYKHVRISTPVLLRRLFLNFVYNPGGNNPGTLSVGYSDPTLDSALMPSM